MKRKNLRMIQLARSIARQICDEFVKPASDWKIVKDDDSVLRLECGDLRFIVSSGNGCFIHLADASGGEYRTIVKAYLFSQRQEGGFEAEEELEQKLFRCAAEVVRNRVRCNAGMRGLVRFMAGTMLDKT